MRIVHHSKTLGYAGTDRTAQLFVKYLNKLPGVEAFLVYRANDNIDRWHECMKTIGEEFLIPYEHEHAKKAQPPYMPASDNLAQVLADLKPDIFHIHRGGHPEWPGMKYLCPDAKIVETNIFAGVDRSPDIDCHIYISNFIAVRAHMLGGVPGPILMNPTEKPVFMGNMSESDFEPARDDALESLELPDTAMLLGRVGRPDNFDPIALKAFKIIADKHPDLYYLVVNPCDRWRQTTEELGLTDRVRFLPKIIRDDVLSYFYSMIDIYAHARVDGECQPCNLNEAMYHGVPIVTHTADTYQGHVEQIHESQAGLVAAHRDHLEYARHLDRLVSNEYLRFEMGNAGIEWAQKNVDAEVVTNKLVEIYEEVLS